MYVKYYGTSKVQQFVGWKAIHPVISTLYCIDPYKRVKDERPSYCVWIVPGTVDCDGNDLTYGNSN